MVTSTFYRFYNIWLNSTVFLGLTVSCNTLALGFRLGRTSLERFSCCASHFIELVGNKCRLEYHNFCLTKCGSSEKIELLSPLGSPLSFSSTTPRPSNVTGGLLFDLGFNHFCYLLLSADLPCLGSVSLKLPWISLFLTTHWHWVPSSANFASEVLLWCISLH